MQQYGNKKQQQGMTLIEVMVAMTIGLVLTLIVTTLFIGQHRSYQQNDATVRMQENGRFALELLIQDLRHAGFFGDLSDPVDVDLHNTIQALVAGGYPECLGGPKRMFELSKPSYILAYGDRMKATFGTSCVLSGDIDSTFGSSVLIAKRSAAEPVADADLESTTIYTYSNGSAAEMYLSNGTKLSDLQNGASWEYQPRIYFTDDKDTLTRKMLNGAGFERQPVAEGIEAFHIEFGIDSNGDGTPDYYYTPSEGNLTDATIDQAVSATVYVLARTLKADKDTDYTDDRTYHLGSITLGPFNDKFHRRVFTATTALKNFRAQHILKSGF